MFRNTMRLTLEYTDTVPTEDIFSFGDVDPRAAYNNFQYIDGMRYRGRTIGFSLDKRFAPALAAGGMGGFRRLDL